MEARTFNRDLTQTWVPFQDLPVASHLLSFPVGKKADTPSLDSDRNGVKCVAGLAQCPQHSWTSGLNLLWDPRQVTSPL